MFDKLEDNDMYAHYWKILTSKCSCVSSSECVLYDMDSVLRSFIDYMLTIEPSSEIGQITDMNWDRIMKIYVNDFVIPNIKLEQPIDITKWKYYV